MTNMTHKKLSALYKQARREKGSQWGYNYYVNILRGMGLTATEYEQAVRKLAAVMQL